jgi:phospho-N-acetylmuramoyl-pentapeptide-transferase
MFTLITCGLLGLVDDIFNIKKIGSHKGLKATTKIIWLFLFALIGGLWFYYKLGYNEINLGLIGSNIEIGWLYIPLFIFVIIGSANAVNITDGLDGLAGGLVILAFTILGIVAYTQGLTILAAFCATIIGASVGFLWFNIPPAAFFMGDTGSLALGATIGVIAMMIDHILLIPFITFIFIVETLSVIAQLISKKTLGKKLFHIAPIHHHFEYIGWPEFRVTMRFWIVGAGIAGLGLILYLADLI